MKVQEKVFAMKNQAFTKAWGTYVLTLSSIAQKRVTRIEKSITEFESRGFDVSKMERHEAQELASIIGDGIAYSSTVSYCAILNRFLKNMEEITGQQYENVYARKTISHCQMYASEDQFLDDVENRIEELAMQARNNPNRQQPLNDEFTEEFKTGLNYIAVFLILRFNGITIDECCNMKMDQIHDNENVIALMRNDKLVLKKFSDRAWKHILDYKHQNYIVHFWAHIVRDVLPTTGYLFRNQRSKDKDIMQQPISSTLLTSAQYRLTKGSNIKKQLALSGAFISFPQRISEPNTLCQYVHDYLGDEPVADTNIKKYWLTFLDFERELKEQKTIASN